MSEEGLVDPAQAADARYGETLLYDFAKFLTTLALIALGGVLTLGQASAPGTIKPLNLTITAIAIVLAGTLSLTVAHELVTARNTGREPRRLRAMLNIALALLGLGAGGFLGMYLDTLK